MNVSIEFEGWTDAKARRMVDTIYDTTLKIFKISDEKDIPIYQATDYLAEERLRSIKAIKGSYLGNLGHRFPGRKKPTYALGFCLSFSSLRFPRI